MISLHQRSSSRALGLSLKGLAICLCLLSLLLSDLLPLGALFSAGPAAALAQDSGARERLLRELERTDEVILEARDVVRASESERARSVLIRAAQLQEVAKGQMQRCGPGNLGACEGAARGTTQARREALHAVQIARQQSQLEQQVAREIERVGQMLEEAMGQAREHPDPRIARLLEAVRNQLERAREQYRARQFQVALRLVRAAERWLRQAVDLGDANRLNPARVRRELERTDRLIERAGPVIRDGQIQRAIELLTQAVDLQARARSRFGDERMVMALRLTQEARARVHRALRLVEGPVDRAAVERAIEQTGQLIERVAPEVRASGNQAATRLFEAGLEHQERARVFLEEGRLSRALAQTRVARNLVLEARDQAAADGP